MEFCQLPFNPHRAISWRLKSSLSGPWMIGMALCFFAASSEHPKRLHQLIQDEPITTRCSWARASCATLASGDGAFFEPDMSSARANRASIGSRHPCRGSLGSHLAEGFANEFDARDANYEPVLPIHGWFDRDCCNDNSWHCRPSSHQPHALAGRGVFVLDSRAPTPGTTLKILSQPFN